MSEKIPNYNEHYNIIISLSPLWSPYAWHIITNSTAHDILCLDIDKININQGWSVRNVVDHAHLEDV